MRNTQPLDHALSLCGIQNVQFESFPAKSVDDVAETLPVDHIYNGIGRSIGKRGVCVICPDGG